MSLSNYMKDNQHHKQGDVIKRVIGGGKSLCIAVTHNECVWLSDQGVIYKANLLNTYKLWYAVKLAYNPFDDDHKLDDDKIKKDFSNGVFDKYFIEPSA